MFSAMRKHTAAGRNKNATTAAVVAAAGLSSSSPERLLFSPLSLTMSNHKQLPLLRRPATRRSPAATISSGGAIAQSFLFSSSSVALSASTCFLTTQRCEYRKVSSPTSSSAKSSSSSSSKNRKLGIRQGKDKAATSKSSKSSSKSCATVQKPKQQQGPPKQQQQTPKQQTGAPAKKVAAVKNKTRKRAPYTYPDPSDVVDEDRLEKKILSLPLRRFKSLFLGQIDPPNTPLEVVVPALRAGETNPGARIITTGDGNKHKGSSAPGSSSSSSITPALVVSFSVSFPGAKGASKSYSGKLWRGEDDDHDDDDDDALPCNVDVKKLAKAMERDLPPTERKALRSAVADAAPRLAGRFERGAFKHHQWSGEDEERKDEHDDEGGGELEYEDKEIADKEERHAAEQLVIDKLPRKLRQFHDEYQCYEVEQQDNEIAKPPSIHCACCGSYVCSLSDAFSYSYGWPMVAKVDNYDTFLQQSWKYDVPVVENDESDNSTTNYGGGGRNSRQKGKELKRCKELDEVLRMSLRPHPSSSSSSMSAVDALVEEKRKKQQYQHLPLNLTKAIIANQQQQSPTMASQLHCNNCTGFLGVAVYGERLAHKRGEESTNQRYVINPNSVFMTMGGL